MAKQFLNDSYSCFNNAISVAGVLFLVSRKYRPQKLIVVLMVYYVVLCGITFYNRTDNASINLIVSYSKLMVYLGLVDYMMRNKQTAAVNDLFQIIFLLLSLTLYPCLHFQMESSRLNTFGMNGPHPMIQFGFSGEKIIEFFITSF